MTVLVPHSRVKAVYSTQKISEQNRDDPRFFKLTTVKRVFKSSKDGLSSLDPKKATAQTLVWQFT
jgi:hypothetical protein